MEVAKRGRGRPKGSRNKKTNLSQATVREICEHHKFNSAEKLIAIATGQDRDENGELVQWDQHHQFQATCKLFDAEHGKNKLPGPDVDESARNQYEIVFLESTADFELPGASGTEIAAEVVREQPVQRAGVSPQDGQDGVRNQSDDSQGADLSA